jgi:hypothetical protein
MDISPKYTSFAAYQDLKLGEKQNQVRDWIWSHRGDGSTEPEANKALASPHAQKRFAELEDGWFIRRTDMERVNPRSGRLTNVFIGTPHARSALANPKFKALFTEAAARHNEVIRLQEDLRLAIRRHEEARRAIHAAIEEVYGPEWSNGAAASGAT